MSKINTDILRTARRASEDAKRVVMLSPSQFDALLDLVKDLVNETELLKTEVENLLDRVRDLEHERKQVKSEKEYHTSDEVKKFLTSDKVKKFITADKPKKFTPTSFI